MGPQLKKTGKEGEVQRKGRNGETETKRHAPELENRVSSCHQVRLNLSSLDRKGNECRVFRSEAGSTTSFNVELETREGHLTRESSIRLDLDLSDSERVLLHSSCETNPNDDVEDVELKGSQL